MAAPTRLSRHPWLASAAALALAATFALAACSAQDAAPTEGSSGGRGDAGVASVGPSGGWSAEGPAFAGADGAAVAPGAMPGVTQEDKAAPAAGGGEVALPEVVDRTIIRNGSVELTVESVADSFDRVRRVAEGAGGLVASSSFFGSGEEQSATLTLRVPADRFAEVVADLRALAVEVDSEQTTSQDVTEEFSDLEATIRNLRAVEDQYLTLLGRADSIGDVLMVQDRLATVRLQIEQVQGRLNLLENLSALATLTVTLRPEAAVSPADPHGGFGDRVAEAWQSSLDTMLALATGVAVVLVWSWWLLPLAPVAWIVGRRLYGRATRPAGPRDVDTPVAPA